MRRNEGVSDEKGKYWDVKEWWSALPEREGLGRERMVKCARGDEGESKGRKVL